MSVMPSWRASGKASRQDGSLDLLRRSIDRAHARSQRRVHALQKLRRGNATWRGATWLLRVCVAAASMPKRKTALVDFGRASQRRNLLARQSSALETD